MLPRRLRKASPAEVTPTAEVPSNQPNPFLTPQPSSSSLLSPPGPSYPSTFRQGLSLGNDSSDHLTLHSPSRRWRGENHGSTEYSNILSRRTSWSSEGGGSQESSSAYSFNPTCEYQRHCRLSTEEDPLTTQTVVKKYAITPSENLLVFPEDIEADDHLHNPDSSDSDRDCNMWTRRGAINLVGLIVVVLGGITLFIIYPILYDCPECKT
ncbi:hypothetical protein ACJ72_08443, partial [Emergomyces africanus]